MPNLNLASRVAARRAKEPTRLERIRSSLSIWQVAIAVASAIVAITLAGLVTHRLKGRTDDKSTEADSASTSSEADSTSTSSQPDSTSTSSEADSTSTSSANDGAPANENALTDAVQEEMHNSGGSSQ